MTNNHPLAQQLYEVSGLEDIGASTANALSDVLMKLDDDKPITDQDWSPVLLHLAIMRRRLEEVERLALACRDERELTWHFEEDRNDVQ